MERKIARPLGNGAKERVNIFLGLPTIVKNNKGETQTIYTTIDTFNTDELFTLAEHKYKIHKNGNKYNTIDTFISQQLSEAKIIQGWFNAVSEKDMYYPIQHYIDYLEKDYRKLCISNGEIFFDVLIDRQVKNRIKSEGKRSKNNDFDIDIWNKECFDLFNYFADNYNSTAKKQKFINIWFYLEYETPDSYVFNFKKDFYKKYITKRFGFDFSKAKINKPNNYPNQLINLENHYKNYCNK